jgi:hypothetical protein
MLQNHRCQNRREIVADLALALVWNGILESTGFGDSPSAGFLCLIHRWLV